MDFPLIVRKAEVSGAIKPGIAPNFSVIKFRKPRKPLPALIVPLISPELRILVLVS